MWTRFKAAVVTVVDAPSDALEQVALVILCLAQRRADGQSGCADAFRRAGLNASFVVTAGEWTDASRHVGITED